MTQFAPPIVETHDGIVVVRDDLLPGGTKARYLVRLFDGAQELVYASPAEGGAQTALAWCAQQLGRRATIFVAARATPHPRALMAKRLGATVVQIRPGYLNVIQARAEAYCRDVGATLVPFGADTPEAIEAIAEAALSTGQDPAEVWCAAGSGTLARGLALAWPNARRHVVQVGRALTPGEVADAEIHIAPMPFGKADPRATAFPSDPHYDAKAWQLCRAGRGAGEQLGENINGDRGPVLFWNVTGPAA